MTPNEIHEYIVQHLPLVKNWAAEMKLCNDSTEDEPQPLTPLTIWFWGNMSYSPVDS